MPDNDSSFPWYRWYNDIPGDKKIESIAESMKLDFALVVGVWSLLMSAAATSPVRGSLYVTDEIRYSNAAVTKTMHCDEEIAEKLMKLFVEYKMIEIDEGGGYRLINFLKRQPPSDNSAARVQKHREKEKLAVTKPLQKRNSNGVDIDKDSEFKDEDSEKEKDEDEDDHDDGPAIMANKMLAWFEKASHINRPIDQKELGNWLTTLSELNTLGVDKAIMTLACKELTAAGTYKIVAPKSILKACKFIIERRARREDPLRDSEGDFGKFINH